MTVKFLKKNLNPHSTLKRLGHVYVGLCVQLEIIHSLLVALQHLDVSDLKQQGGCELIPPPPL